MDTIAVSDDVEAASECPLSRVNRLPPPYLEFDDCQAFSYLSSRSVSTEQILQSAESGRRRKICCRGANWQLCLTNCLQFKRILVLLAVCITTCLATSIILGVIRLPESSYITLSLMFAGLALLLMCIALIGWRCTPSDNEPCHLLFGLGTYSVMPHRNPNRANSMVHFQWQAGRMFPEFRFRRPPPSYAVSMQEHQAAVSSLRSRGLIPQTPPPQYKLNRSTRRGRTSGQIIYPVNPGRNEVPPPEYTPQEPAVQEPRLSGQSPIQSISFISQNRSPLRDGIENPTFQSEERESLQSQTMQSQPAQSQLVQSQSAQRHTADAELTNEIILSINSRSIPRERSTADDPISCSDFSASLGQVTHL